MDGMLLAHLTTDCGLCRGLCCTALYFSREDGFPRDKPAGTPCVHLSGDFRCHIHGELKERKLKGCMAFDCLGAGQWAVRMAGDSGELPLVFSALRELHQILWYLGEAAAYAPEAEGLSAEGLVAAKLTVDEFLVWDMAAYRARANQILKQVVAAQCTVLPHKRINVLGAEFGGADLSRMDFTMTLLIAANLAGCRLYHTSLLGADMRDADVRGADMGQCLFLTQGQINAARGDNRTLLPPGLERPGHW